ncbi:erythromycin esterase family protein [Mycetocola miduiensis]|uniref:Erythromycin esterase homolog n=1 Tax=Mycetocola miduiensis TaxID=995034 RepID=A0A1I4ZX70_9MICO|nr:erythromycin esterase family protein [Mycetocola miduiensis]SFN54756.1 Erythromycin esterase homolog [Mycetocola miduiensis]
MTVHTEANSYLADIRGLAHSLRGPADLNPILSLSTGRRFVAIGEASHGTHEYYQWRARLSRRLIEEQGFTWIGVEGDWPDCWRIDRWVRGLANQNLDAHGLLAQFDRWPTWMWANAEVADFLDWLHEWNVGRQATGRVGFYGLDVYSLWDSLDRVISWLAEHHPDSVPAALRAWQCFTPYQGDPHRYAWSTRLVPQSCETDVVNLLVAVRHRAAADGEDAFDAEQNAQFAVGAERYYRAMVRTDRGSWDIRDIHMADTIDRVTRYLGPRSKGIIWEHNTHIGDARGTSMAEDGLVNVGQLLRDHYSDSEVLLVGLAGYRGEVVASTQWGAAEQRMRVPAARAGSHEALLHEALGASAVLDFRADPDRPWLRQRLGHRAIGVVYDPDREWGNYVPTVMGRRYDALIWLEDTSALRPLAHERTPEEAEYETEPTGY